VNTRSACHHSHKLKGAATPLRAFEARAIHNLWMQFSDPEWALAGRTDALAICFFFQKRLGMIEGMAAHG
jgi:hypothetical protein